MKLYRAWDKKTNSYIEAGFDFRIDGNGYVYRRIWGESQWERTSDLEIEQSTSLKDKNGKEIYEGDIIEAYSETINIGTGRPTGKWKRTHYTIEWKAPMFTKRRHKDNYLDAFGIGSQELVTKYYEVIGNIHNPHNPELLEESNK